MKKKIFALVMISVMTLGMFGGCSSEEETAEEATEEAPAEA